MLIDGPLVHRLARRYTTTGLRGSGRMWKCVERVRPLPDRAALRAGHESIELDLAGDIVDRPLYRGEYERAELHIASQRLSPGAVFVDVGANRGLYTALAVSRGASVTAVEPHPELADELRRRFPTIRVEEVAASDAAGRAALHVFPNSTYMSTLRQTGVDGSIIVEVPTVRLDILMKDADRIDLMKIDVEHLEASVLDGAANLFVTGRVRTALVEVLVDHDRIAAMTRSWGYRSRLVGYRGNVVRRPALVPIGIESGQGGNYLLERTNRR